MAPPEPDHRQPATNNLGRLVIFVNEIDYVRSLPFSTDEFFAAIRECYNRRAHEPAFNRLAFGLLGVATPTDLIRDTRMTPFNIGRRIELNDFTKEEATPLAQGLVNQKSKNFDPQLVLERILFWTNGHPYLTQRLCQAAAHDPELKGADGVDRLCDTFFLSNRAREREDNLLFVRERLLRSEADGTVAVSPVGWRGRRTHLAGFAGLTRCATIRVPDRSTASRPVAGDALQVGWLSNPPQVHGASNYGMHASGGLRAFGSGSSGTAAA